MTFFENVQLLCADRGVTLKVMAMRIRMSYSTVRGWKYKDRNFRPERKTVTKLAEYFHVPESFFFDEPVSEELRESLRKKWGAADEQ